MWQKSPSQPGLHPKLQKPLKILQFLQVGWHFSEHSSPKNPYGHAVKIWKYILKNIWWKIIVNIHSTTYKQFKWFTFLIYNFVSVSLKILTLINLIKKYSFRITFWAFFIIDFYKNVKKVFFTIAFYKIEFYQVGNVTSLV